MADVSTVFHCFFCVWRRYEILRSSKEGFLISRLKWKFPCETTVRRDEAEKPFAKKIPELRKDSFFREIAQTFERHWAFNDGTSIWTSLALYADQLHQPDHILLAIKLIVKRFLSLISGPSAESLSSGQTMARLWPVQAGCFLNFHLFYHLLSGGSFLIILPSY